MMVEQFLAILEPIEKRYRPAEYTDQERTDLYEKFKWMTSDQWEHLVGRILASDPYRLPGEKYIDKIYDAHRREYKKTKRSQTDCRQCKSRGILMWMKRERDSYTTSVAQCSCDNGGDWPMYPTRDAVRFRADFVRWLGSDEIPLEAIEAQTYTDREEGKG